MLLVVIYIHLRTNQTIFFCDTQKKWNAKVKREKFQKENQIGI